MTNAAGVAITDATISLREKGTTTWIPAADFALYVDTTNVTVEVRAEKAGFASVTAEATVLIKPRPVTLVAGSDSKTYDGTPLTCDTFTVKEGTAPEYGFVGDEGVASVTMTLESTITEPGLRPNVIASVTAKDGTKLDRNYTVTTEPGTLTVTAAAMGIQAFGAEKFYDAEPTNITWVVTNATGGVIADATISLREKRTDPWIPAADFAQYVDTTNVTVEVRAEKAGFASVTAEATVLVKPRPVTLVAASDLRVYDGLPLTNWTFTVEADVETPGYGFVNDEGVASVTMTPESTVTLPDTVPNEIATTVAKPDTKLDRNYTVTTEPGTLTVTAASMGIQAFPVEKFYDAEPTNVTWAVTNAAGVAIVPDAVSLREAGTDPWIPAADFALYVDTTNVTVQVRAEKAGFASVTAEATVLVKPRPVTLVAASDSKVYDGLPLTNWTFTVEADAETPGYGFVDDEGVASVTMTPESTVTLPDTKPNVIATTVAKEGTKLERNYTVTTEPGTLTVTAAAMGIQAFGAEKFYDAEPTNITWVVTNAAGAAITDATISLREKGTTTWIPAADFAQYVDTTNVTVQVRAEKAGFTSVTAEATVLVKPRPVTLVAGSAEKTYDGTPLTCDDFEVKDDDTTAAIPGYGFVNDEGVASVTMTPESTVTLPDTVPNVIVTEIAKEGTKLDRNYTVTTVNGTLTVTAAAMGIQEFGVEKFYDAEPTNITWAVTNAAGVAIVPDAVSLREKGTTTWIPAADFAQYVDTTNATVQVRAEKSGFDPVTAEATVLVKPRPVTLVAASDSKVYDGLPLTNWTFTVEADAETPGYGFVNDEGVASVTMTPESTVTLPDTKPNVIATEIAKEGTKLDRNYTVTTEPGTLTVTAAAMGIAAFDAEKFYDAEGTNITWVVTNAAGVAITDATISLREKGTTAWIPAADFAQYVDTTNATVQVRAEKAGFTAVEAEATVAIKPRPVTLVAASDSKVYDGLPLTNWTFTVEADAETPGYGFVDGEGVASVTMTPESAVTLPDTVPNEIATTVAKPDTKLDRNYTVTTEKGTLTVTAASMGIAAFDAEKFYDAEPTNITWIVTNATGGVISDATISLREKGTGPWIPAADFTPYVDTTNVTVEVKAEKSGFDPVTAEATVLVKPRPVTLVAASDSKVYDGLPLTNWTFTVEADAETPGYGFVDGEGVASVTMTPESTVTLPGSKPNVIATEVAKEGTKLERNYTVTTEKGTLTVTPATFTASAEPVEKFYDSEPTNITVTVAGVPAGVTPTYEYSYSETDGYVSAADFTGPTNVSESATVYCRVIIPGTTNTVHAMATIKPRIVVSHAKDGSWTFDGAEHAHPESYEDEDAEASKSKAKWGTDEVLPGSTGFVEGEGYAADLVMTADSKIKEPGTQPNVIDQTPEKTALAADTHPENYELYYLDGTLTVWQREEEVWRDPEERRKIDGLPEETKRKIAEADARLTEDLEELEASDPLTQTEPYVKYQVTVTPKEKLTERNRTTPAIAGSDAAAQEMLVEADAHKYVDIVIERTTSKAEVQATKAGNYNKDNWDSLDDADAHGRTKILSVIIPLDIPDGMELVAVTRSCHPEQGGVTHGVLNEITDPLSIGSVEGFVYDPATKTVTLYARDFCVFGFHMRRSCQQLFCAFAYRVKLAGKTVTGKEVTKGKAGSCDYESNCWAKPASFRVAGYIYNASLTEPAECEECECNAFADVQSHFWTADRKQAFAGEPLTFDVFDILRNGGLKNKAQLCIKIGENIKLAGFGAFNPESRKLKSANGFFAGVLAAPTCGKLGEDCEWGTTPAKVFAPCALEEPIEDGATAAIVYGRWTMTYKADKVRQIEKDNNFGCLYPTGFTYSAVP